MAITAAEWDSIRNLVLQVAGSKRGESFVLGKVQKVDGRQGLIYLSEFGDQPIPMLNFQYQVKYYDTRQDGTTLTRVVYTTLVLPKPGQLVLVACEWGSQRLPRCLGILPPKPNWVIVEDE